MTSTLTFISIGFAVLLLGLLIGGAGGNRSHRRKLHELESDVVSLNERLTREQKKRAGVAVQESRKDHMAEAMAIAQAAKASTPASLPLRGRANHSLSE